MDAFSEILSGLKLNGAVAGKGVSRVAKIAAEVDYESEAAFNRAFKRQFGKPPGPVSRRV